MKRNARKEHIRKIKRHRRPRIGIRTHPCGAERNKRHHEQPRDVAPQNLAVHGRNIMQNKMMIHPVDGDKEKTQHIRKQSRSKRQQIGKGVPRRQLKLQNHNRNDNCEDAVAESLQSVLLRMYHLPVPVSRSLLNESALIYLVESPPKLIAGIHHNRTCPRNRLVQPPRTHKQNLNRKISRFNPHAVALTQPRRSLCRNRRSAHDSRTLKSKHHRRLILPGHIQRHRAVRIKEDIVVVKRQILPLNTAVSRVVTRDKAEPTAVL